MLQFFIEDALSPSWTGVSDPYDEIIGNLREGDAVLKYFADVVSFLPLPRSLPPLVSVF